MTTLLDAVGEEPITRFRGQLIAPQDRRSDEARQVYNAMIDKRPALVARCADVADVIAAIDFGLWGPENSVRGLSRELAVGACSDFLTTRAASDQPFRDVASAY